MLDQMRKQARSAIVLLLFGFIIFVFVFSFGSGAVGFRSGGCGALNAAAMVNGETIPLEDYRFVYQQQFQQLIERKSKGQLIRKEDKLQLADQVLEQMINQRLLIQAARELGLRVTDDERSDAIRENPIFQDKSKNFDFKRYKNIVEGYFKTTTRVYEEFYRQQMLVERMADVIQSTARMTKEELEQSYRQRETKVDLEFVNLSPNIYKIGAKPTDADIDAFIKDQMPKVEAFYKDNESRYRKPKKLQLAHIFWEIGADFSEDQITDREERAQLTVDDLKKGAKFEDQAKDYSQDSKTREKGGDLGTFTLEDLTARYGAKFAEDVFALEQGKTSSELRSEKGFHVVKVTKETPAVEKPLESVQRDIARELVIAEQAEAKAKAEAERLLAGIKAGKTLEELTKVEPAPASPDAKPVQFNPLSSIKANNTGPVARMMGMIPQLGIDKDLARAAFELTKEKPIPEKVWQVSGFGGKTHVVFRLIDKIEPDMAMFAEAEPVLRKNLLAGRRQHQLSSWLDSKREASAIQVNEALRNNPNPLAGQQGR